MRPLELSLGNFRSFYTGPSLDSRVTFDFRHRRLIGIVGPIGSGKSTILDAIAFALYGRTPRVARSTKSLVHQRADVAHVRLRFEVDGEVWEVVRMLRSTRGPSQHALYRYTDDTPDAEAIDTILQETEVNGRVAELLGFDFDAFGRSVLLAQGQFAEFLTARPSERDKVLKGVFGYERIDTMRELAKQRISEDEFEIDKLGIKLENVEQAMARLAQHKLEFAEAEERLAVLDKHRDRVAELTERHLTARRDASAAGDRLDVLQRHVGRMPDADTTDDMLRRATEARAERSRLAKQLEDAHAALTAAENTVKSSSHRDAVTRLEETEKSLAERAVRHGAVESADQHWEAAKRRHSNAVEQAEALAGRVELAERAVDETARAAADAAESATTAEAALHAATHADMAATLAAQLAAGDDCPVCSRPLDAPPEIEMAADIEDSSAVAKIARESLRAAEAAATTAVAELAAVRESAARARAHADESSHELQTLAAAAGDARAALDAIEALLTATLDSDQHDRAVSELRRRITEAHDTVDVARRSLDDARTSHDAAIAQEQESDRALGDLRTQLGALAAVLEADADLPEDDPDALRAARDALRSRWAETMERVKADLDRSTTAADEAAATVAELLADLGVGDSFDAACAQAEATVELLGRSIEADVQLVASSEDLLAARNARVVHLDHLRRVSGDLTESKFIRYLLGEERAVLSELGSDHFQRLSSGRYRFSGDGTFEIVDLTAADAVRKADSLSGGETFLASLGLALGLAEMVSRTGGRLDAFFLDEGFGSLDLEHLDLAMDGIEQLVADGSNRLVVIVSHVPEMRQRMEDLIVLDRDPTTGDSIVVAGATN